MAVLDIDFWESRRDFVNEEYPQELTRLPSTLFILIGIQGPSMMCQTIWILSGHRLLRNTRQKEYQDLGYPIMFGMVAHILSANEPAERMYELPSSGVSWLCIVEVQEGVSLGIVKLTTRGSHPLESRLRRSSPYKTKPPDHSRTYVHLERFVAVVLKPLRGKEIRNVGITLTRI